MIPASTIINSSYGEFERTSGWSLLYTAFVTHDILFLALVDCLKYTLKYTNEVPWTCNISTDCHNSIAQFERHEHNYQQII